jgi:3-oxoacyl-(acyl-carrier-protein) reductase
LSRELEGKVAIVTGASRGIGKAIALRLAKDGATVVMNYLAGDECAAVAEKEVKAASAASRLHAADVTVAAQAEDLVRRTIQDFGRVDILVNNAGIARDGFFHKLTEEQWHAVINTNLNGAFNVTRHVIPPMRAARTGRVISISSVIGFTGNLGQTSYAASKAAIVGFTKSLALENAALGITVNAIAPGFIETSMLQQIPKDILETTLKRVPSGRFGKPEDIAATVRFLVSHEAAYITGQTIHVNGGLYL